MAMRIGVLDPKEDLYAVLGVSPDATAPTIQKAHRRLARVSHPDVAGAAGERAMKRINFAASVLLDPNARARYDRLRAAPRPVARPAEPSWPDQPPSPPFTRLDPTPIPQPAPIGDWLQQASALLRRKEHWLVAFALVVPALAVGLATLAPGPVPVASSDYRLPPMPPTVMTTYLDR